MKEDMKQGSYIRPLDSTDGIDPHQERQWARSKDLGITSPSRVLERGYEAGIVGNIQRVRETAADPFGLKNVPQPFNSVYSRSKKRNNNGSE